QLAAGVAVADFRAAAFVGGGAVRGAATGTGRRRARIGAFEGSGGGGGAAASGQGGRWGCAQGAQRLGDCSADHRAGWRRIRSSGPGGGGAKHPKEGGGVR